MKIKDLKNIIKEEIKLLKEQNSIMSGLVCCCNGQNGGGTTFFENGSTCDDPNIENCQNQEMQGDYSNMVPWNMVNTYSEAGAGSSFPGNAEINGQIPVGIWSVNNPGSCTYGGNDFGMPYVWFTEQLTDENGNCIPNPINCQVEESTRYVCSVCDGCVEDENGPFNSLEECQVSGCSENLEDFVLNTVGLNDGVSGMTAVEQYCIKCSTNSWSLPFSEKCECCENTGEPESFQCSDFLNINPTFNNNELWHEAVCSMFCNPWGSGIGPGFADAALSDIPNLDWEEATGPQMTGYTPVDDFNIFDPQYETSTIQGYYDPGGLCSLGCCEGLVNPSFGSASENYDVCNEPGNELDWGWLNYSQQEQDLVCAMINNGGSIEVELFGNPVTMTIPFVIAIDYWQCCSESADVGQTDGMALLSKNLTQNDIDKLQTKLKKDEKKSQQLSKGNSQKMRMQKLAGIKTNKK
jgi:hypothetical protein